MAEIRGERTWRFDEANITLAMEQDAVKRIGTEAARESTQ
jgi:hypothetical protein